MSLKLNAHCEIGYALKLIKKLIIVKIVDVAKGKYFYNCRDKTACSLKSCSTKKLQNYC
jgi:hypothetical protein